MLNFELTEEQRALQDTARKFAREEVAPVARELDEKGEFPRDLIKKTWEIGLTCENIPQEAGGLGLGSLETCLIQEEIAAACPGVCTCVAATGLALTPIILFASDEQKKEFLGPFTEEFKLAAFCLTEPEAGSDAGNMSTTAVKDGDDYILNGTKQWITNGGVADLLTVFATVDRSKRYKGITAFIVPADLPGITPGPHEDKMGHRCSNTTPVVFENVRVPAKNMIGKEGQGFGVAMGTLDKSRPTVAAGAVGLARAALEHSIQYAKERKQFGQPIANLQAINFMLADMTKEVEAARLLTWYAAWLLDNKKPATKVSSMCKVYATDTAMKVATDAVQIFGGYGYVKEYPVEKLMRDAKLMQIYEGTNQIQRVVIANQILA